MVHDLAIVGAGPGGLHAAKWAAKKGLKVLLIEKRKDISKITRYCSEHIILDEDYNGDTIKVDPKRGKVISTVNGWEVNYDGELCPVTDKYYYSPQQHAIHFAWPDKSPFAYKYDKGHLLQTLLEECLALGINYQNETTSYDAIDSPDGVELKCVRKGKKSKVKAKKLIIADGSITRIGEAMGFNKDRAYMGNALCLATYMSGVKTYNPSEWKGWWGRCYGSNLAPLMGTGPAGHFDWADMIILGSPKDPAEQVFEYFTKKSPLADLFKDAKIEERYCCSVKAFTPIKMPYRGNALIIGDAAAFVEVQAQGALNCGFWAADAVAKELEGKKGFEQYTKKWLDSFEFNSEGMMRVQQGYALIPTYTDDEIDYLFTLCEGVTLDGSWSQYKSPKLIWGTILKDPDKIKRERPALFQKIKSVRSSALQESI
jgi:digeranylgeranylglycerophospholipid reductase